MTFHKYSISQAPDYAIDFTESSYSKIAEVVSKYKIID